jgi:hypothetical protein
LHYDIPIKVANQKPTHYQIRPYPKNRRLTMRRFHSILTISLLVIASALAVFAFGKIDRVQAEPESTPANAQPVYCETAVGIGFEGQFSCRRGDTDEQVLPVPAGHYLIVTDIHVTRNNVSTSGVFSVLIGVDDDDSFPRAPRLDITGTPIGVYQLNFTAPYIILEGGETLSIHNFASSDFPIDAYVSGFLVDDVTYQAFFQAYLPITNR